MNRGEEDAELDNSQYRNHNRWYCTGGRIVFYHTKHGKKENAGILQLRM
jgi:hypothetical protein